MGLYEKLCGLRGNKRSAAAVGILGTAGLLLIMVSSLAADKNEIPQTDDRQTTDIAQSYCMETEARLEAFLEKIEGAGDVKVYLTVGTGERYIYAAEEKRSESDNRIDKEEKYVIVGGSSSREPLIEAVETPEITGAVVICSGCGSPVVEERIYKAASAALGLPTSKIYVTEMAQ